MIAKQKNRRQKAEPAFLLKRIFLPANKCHIQTWVETQKTQPPATRWFMQLVQIESER